MAFSEEELDKLHDVTMENLYEVFSEELNVYFKFEEAALTVLGYGCGHFPFSASYDCCMENIAEALEAIEKNIFDHIETQLEFIFKEKNRNCVECTIHSKELKKQFNEKLRLSVKKILSSKEENENFNLCDEE